MNKPNKTVSKESIMQAAKLIFERWLEVESLKIAYGYKKQVAANDNELPNLIA